VTLSKKTFEIAKETGNDFLVQVKENQQQLLSDCIDTQRFNTETKIYVAPPEKGHGRIEHRTITVHKTTNWITDSAWKLLVATIIVVARARLTYNTKTKKWNTTEEISYYVCNNDKYTAIEFCDAIRNHWGIENCNHYVKDTAFNEDASKVRKKPKRMAIMRSFALNVLRVNGIKNVCQALYRNAINYDVLRKYRAVFD
jgi:predicted transposase YbfD/YdcC